MNRLTPHQRIELLVALLALPTIGTVAWTLDLKLAGGVLGVVWVLVVALYTYESTTADDGPRSVPVAPQPTPATTGATPATDPAAALLAALGERLTGGKS